MGASQSISGKVVIIGAGFAGTAAARQLEEQGVDVTLIERQDGFTYHTIGALRGCVNEETAKQVLVPLDHLLTRGKLIFANVVDILENEVVLASSEHVPFDALIIATGAVASFPARPPAGFTQREQVLSAFSHVREAISRAKVIAVIGGGPVGYEFAGEIREAFPAKQTHLFHAGRALMDGVPLTERSRSRLLQSLEGHGAVAHLGVKVDLQGITEAIQQQDVKYIPMLDRTQSGNPYPIKWGDNQELAADLVLLCVGNSVQVDTNPLYECTWWKSHASAENPTRLRVNQYLQVEDNVFCIGDAASLPELQVAYLTKAHATAVVNNVKQLLQSKTNPQFTPAYKPYTPATGGATILAPFGSTGGGGQIGSFSVGEWVSSKLKGRTLFIPARYQDVNAPVPV